MSERLPAAVSVLVVDDEPSVHGVFQRLFTRMGYAFEAVASGQDALGRLAAKPYDVFLLDKNLPPPTGVELARTIRAKYPDAVIILITGHASAQSATDLVGVADEYLTKPFELDTVRETVTALVARQAQRSVSRPSPVPTAKPGQKRVQVVTDAAAEVESLGKICEHLGASLSPQLALHEDPDVLVVAGSLCTFDVRKAVWAWQARKKGVRVVVLVDPKSASDASAAVALKAQWRIARPIALGTAHLVMQGALT